MKTVLVVDDSKVSRMTNVKLLRELGYEVIGEAVDGLDGLEKFKHLSPDLILTDIEMPKLDGIGMIKEIRQSNNDINIVVASSLVNSYTIQEVLRLKATVIKKPIKEKNFLKAIELLSK